MKQVFPTLLRAAGSRVARNIYFWALLLGTRLDYPYTPLAAALSAVLFLLLALLFYTNNLVLVPRFLARRDYSRYLPLYAGLVLIVALLYTAVLKWTLFRHPEVPTGMISPITTLSETADMRFGALLAEMPSYYLALFIAGAVFTMGWFVSDYQRLQRRAEAARQKYLETELSFLKSQINPHFLFNTLNNLYALTVKKSNESPQVVAQLSTILRYFLYESDAPQVSSEKELDMMRAYIDLESLRINEKAGLRFFIAADGVYTLPPLLWVPLLENVFKHGTRQSGPCDVEFRFTLEDSVLRIFSRNRTAPDTASNASGIGLANLRKRLGLLYPGRHSLDISAEEYYFTAQLQIRLTDDKGTDRGRRAPRPGAAAIVPAATAAV